MTTPTKEQIITKMAHFYKDNISKRAFRILSRITELTPGMACPAIAAVEKSMDHVLSGGMLVLSGRIGCGKTIASIVGALLYQYQKYEGRASWLNWEKSGYYHIERDRRQPGEDSPPEPEGNETRITPQFEIIPSRAIIKAPFGNDPEMFAEYDGLLVIDDMGREHFTDKGFGIAEWDHLFNSRYSEMRPTIFTTNMTQELFVEKYDHWVLDRLKECAVWEQLSDKSLRRKEA